MRTLEQRRAADALARVGELDDRSDGFKSLYRAYVDRLGPAIVMNGLGQALATERAMAGGKTNERERAHGALCESLARWLCRKEDGVYPGRKDLLAAVVAEDESLYLRAQAEALAWLEWHKKGCRASFPKAADDEP